MKKESVEIMGTNGGVVFDEDFSFHHDDDIADSQFDLIVRRLRLDDITKDLQQDISYNTKVNLLKEKKRLEMYIAGGL